MPNDVFHFKQFSVWQKGCAMKVSTDACLFGALIAPQNLPSTILDIGTGTGLLSLMLAQRFDSKIVAVEIDPLAAADAIFNFEHSPWKHRLSLITGDIKSLLFSNSFDCIISNPPFFENDLKSPSSSKNMARHTEHLTLENLTVIVSNLLSDDGEFWVLLPPSRMKVLEKLFDGSNLTMEKVIHVYPKEGKAISRQIACFRSRKGGQLAERNVIVHSDKNSYTNYFNELMQDYYL